MAEKKETYPVLPLRDIVVYPKMVVPLFVGREKSIRALQAGVDSDKNIILERSARFCSCCACRTERSKC